MSIRPPVRSLANEAITGLLSAPGRHLVGITGPPGAGKSTLMAALVRACRAELGDACVAGVPMDGFHKPNEILIESGRRNRKGAPDTFDADAFVAAIRQLSTGSSASIRWPDYSHQSDEVIPNAISVSASAKLIFVEGNYLLLEEDPWSHIRAVVKPIWYVTADRPTLEGRLLRRQRRAGVSNRDAEQHVFTSDLLNATQVEGTMAAADRVVELDPADPLLRGLVDPGAEDTPQAAQAFDLGDEGRDEVARD
jgi:pantothenate kinase